MMQYTNKHNYPEIVTQWLQFDEYDYDPKTISATTLMKPARMFVLERKNWDNLEVDVSDLVASRYGTAIHDSVEKVPLKDCIQEERLRTEINGYTITGKFDILHKISNDEYELIDVKSTSVWTVIYGSKDIDYITQLSIYRYLARDKYKVSKNARIWFVFTDWSQSKAKNDPEYPQSRCMMKDINLWSYADTEKYIKSRLALFEEEMNQPEDDLILCSDTDLWAEQEKYAIMKENRKSAIKLHDTKQDAEKHLNTLGKTYYIEHRPGKVKRCNYCCASKFCSQYIRLSNEGRVD